MNAHCTKGRTIKGLVLAERTTAKATKRKVDKSRRSGQAFGQGGGIATGQRKGGEEGGWQWQPGRQY